MNDLETRIMKCLKKVKGSTFDETENLIFDGWIDSFDILNLVKALEEEFEIKIAMEKIEPECFNSILSIGEMVKSFSE